MAVGDCDIITCCRLNVQNPAIELSDRLDVLQSLDVEGVDGTLRIVYILAIRLALNISKQSDEIYDLREG